MKILKKTKDNFYLVNVYYNLSEYYQKTKQNLALHYAKLAYATSTKLNNADYRLESLTLLMRIKG